MRVKLLDVSANPEKLIFACGRQCYSEGWVGDSWKVSEDGEISIYDNKTGKLCTDNEITGLIKHLVRSGHTSVLEHVKFTFAIDGISRSNSHQQVRHRVSSYCVAGDTRIATLDRWSNDKTIKELFDVPQSSRNKIPVKCVDTATGLIYHKDNATFIYSGIKDLYHVKAGEFVIKTTLDHRFLTPDGWVRLKDLSVGSIVKVFSNNRVVDAVVDSIEHVEQAETYDISMQGPYHNFIANGFVVHNSQQSQRYVANTGPFDPDNFVTPPTISRNEAAHMVFNRALQNMQEAYNSLIELGIPAEDARYLMPNASITRIVDTKNCVSLLHFFSLRCCTLAQWEIREMANKMLAICKEVLPVVFEEAGPKCVQLGYCNESKQRSCGRYPTKKEVLDGYKAYIESLKEQKDV